MKILLIGANGSMGRRYAAIFKYLGVDFAGVDIGDKWQDDFDRALVCTPTNTHFEICNKLIDMRKDFLCEKPVSKEPNECIILRERCEATGVKGLMVCNWRYAFDQEGFYLVPGLYDVFYDYYNTGKDGLHWDCIQLHYLARTQARLSISSPIFNCVIDGIAITHREIEKSYKRMIEDWIKNFELLWTMEDAIKATKKVKEIYERLDSSSH